MNIEEIIQRLENMAKHAVHTPGEIPFVMSLDDGIALHEAAELLKQKLSDIEQFCNTENMDKAKIVVNGNCILCGKPLNCGRLFICKECESNQVKEN